MANDLEDKYREQLNAVPRPQEGYNEALLRGVDLKLDSRLGSKAWHPITSDLPDEGKFYLEVDPPVRDLWFRLLSGSAKIEALRFSKCMAAIPDKEGVDAVWLGCTRVSHAAIASLYWGCVAPDWLRRLRAWLMKFGAKL